MRTLPNGCTNPRANGPCAENPHNFGAKIVPPKGGTPNYAPSIFNSLLVEIVVRIAHVRVFRLVTDFRRKFSVTAMDVRNV